MSEQAKPHQAGTALAEIARRQEQAIDAVLMPAWYWWAVAAACAGIGAAVDSHDAIARAVMFPAAIGVIVTLTAVMISGRYRRARARSSDLLRGTGTLAIAGTVWLVVGVTLGTGFGLRAAGSPIPATIATIAGGAVMLVAGPVLRQILRRIMLRNLAAGR